MHCKINRGVIHLKDCHFFSVVHFIASFSANWGAATLLTVDREAGIFAQLPYLFQPKHRRQLDRSSECFGVAGYSNLFVSARRA